jgi:hypothetical protein
VPADSASRNTSGNSSSHNKTRAIQWRDCVRRSRSNLIPLSRRVQYHVSIRRRRSGGRLMPNTRIFAPYRHWADGMILLCKGIVVAAAAATTVGEGVVVGVIAVTAAGAATVGEGGIVGLAVSVAAAAAVGEDGIEGVLTVAAAAAARVSEGGIIGVVVVAAEAAARVSKRGIIEVVVVAAAAAAGRVSK